MLLSVTNVASLLCVEGLEGLPDSLLSPVAVWNYHSFLLERVARQSPKDILHSSEGTCGVLFLAK